MHGKDYPRSPTRRSLAMALPLVGCAVWLPEAFAFGAPAIEKSQRFLMGTQVDLIVQGQEPAVLQSAMNQAWTQMHRLTVLMSRYRADSAVSAINRAAGTGSVAVAPEVMSILRFAKDMASQTHGAFDPTVGALKAWRFDEGQTTLPSDREIDAQRQLIGYRGLTLDPVAGTARLQHKGMALDLGGIAKLPILEAGMNTLKAHGIANAMINGGGDVLVAGQMNGHPWRVGLRDPRAPAQLLGVLHLRDQAVVASSGDYERFFLAQGVRQHHILNPATGRPTQGPRGVSLLAPDVASVNGLGAALMVMGSRAAPALLQSRPGTEALVVQRNHQVWQTPGMAAMLRAV